MKRLDKHISAIDTLCIQYKVKTLYVFGSVLNEHFSSKSDIDLVVEFDSNLPVEDYVDNYFNFKFSLKDILKRPVDLLEEQAIKNPYFKQQVDREKQLLYA